MNNLIKNANTPNKRKAIVAFPFFFVAGIVLAYRDTYGFYDMEEVSVKAILMLMGAAVCLAFAFGRLGEWISNGQMHNR